MPDKRSTPQCGFVPYPGNGAYGHWKCQLAKRHGGRHRFNNYTIARIPHLWDLHSILRSLRTTRRLRRFARKLGQSPQRYRLNLRRPLYPATYDPITRFETEGQ